MGMAIGYDLFIFQRFVGSLRRSGFSGNIILGVDPLKVDSSIEQYLMAKNVTMQFIQHVECATQFVDANDTNLKASQKELLSCLAPYQYLKARWGRFPLLRDYLVACEQCTGPVLVMDVRDSFFQRDPFGDDAPPVKGLQVFEEDPRMRTTNWLVEWPVRECKNMTFDRPMLCSGTTVGTRQSMLDYLDAMHAEMVQWMKDPKCHFKINGDDQSIHNYLYYTGKLNQSAAKAVPNRMGIVNTVGAQAAAVKKDHLVYTKERGIRTDREAQMYPYRGTNLTAGSWVGEQYRLTDEKGYFTNLDGQRSFVVHQYDRFGYQLERWLQKYMKATE